MGWEGGIGESREREGRVVSWSASGWEGRRRKANSSYLILEAPDG